MKVQKGMKLGYKIAAYLGTTILTAIVTAGIQSLSVLDYHAYIAVILVLALACCSIYLVMYEKNMEANSDVNKRDSTIESLTNDLLEKKKKLEEPDPMSEEFGVSEGDSYLAMSFTQGWSLKIEYLKKSKDSGNLIAALILASIYDCGIEEGGRVILEKDYEEAAKIYKDFEDEDKSGVCSWMLGWYYENREIDDAQALSENESFTKAYGYYEASKDKKFAKAFNSIGKFMLYGRPGCKNSLADADVMFIEAAKLKDFYAYNNRGLSSMKKYDKENDKDIKDGHLSDAKEAFEKSAEFGSTEAELQLGKICEIQAKKVLTSEKESDADDKIKFDSKKSTNIESAKNEKTPEELISEAKTRYIKAFERHDEKTTAPALYRLGKLINEHPELAEDQDLSEALAKMGRIRFNDLAVECMMRAYEEFERVGNDKFGLEYKNMYKKLKENISNVLKEKI